MNLRSKLIDLFRHGAPGLTGVYLGHTDCPLSVDGRLAAAGAVSVQNHWDLIVCSPLMRCLETAQWLADRTGKELLVLPELKEFNFGNWDGRSFEEVYASDKKQADRFWADPQNAPPPGGETIEEFRLRVNKGLKELLDHPAINPLVITHGGVIRMLTAEILGVDVERWSQIKVDYSHFTQLRFDYDGEQCWPQLISSNIKHPQTLPA